MAVALREVEDPQTRRKFSLLRCGGCGLGQTDPIPGDLAPYYAEYHGGRHGATARLCLRRRMRLLRAAAPRAGRLLDLGCGDGSFLLQAREEGWQVRGTEFSPQLARGRGLDVAESLDELGGNELFDCITLWHSFEHLRDPLCTMRRLRELLAPGGALLLAVPDSGGLQARLFGRYWLHLDVPRHLFHYTRRSLSALLQSAGFEARWWRHQEFEYDLLGWPQSALNALTPAPNLFFQLLMGRSPACGSAEKFFHYAAGGALTLLSLPLVPLGSLIGRGGTLLVAARALK
jgi:SAM-dependent methyltransferase